MNDFYMHYIESLVLLHQLCGSRTFGYGVKQNSLKPSAWICYKFVLMMTLDGEIANNSREYVAVHW